MKNFVKISLIVFLLFVIASCNNDDNNPGSPNPDTIAGFVNTNADYSLMLEALQKTNLLNTLDGTDNFTVFAPNNTAFENYLSANRYNSLDEVPVDLLSQLLLNHVVAGAIEASGLATGYINSEATFGDTQNKISLYIDSTSGIGIRINSVVTITSTDLVVSNGIIHTVDELVEIPTIVTHVTANSDFSKLLEAITLATDSTVDYFALLSGSTSSPFTVFAPTNTAFNDLLLDLGHSSLDEIPVSALQLILNYHVIVEANIGSTDLSEGQLITTFQGEDLTISLVTGTQVVDASGIPANIVLTNVQSGNGIVHAVDKVLLSQEFLDL